MRLLQHCFDQFRRVSPADQLTRDLRARADSTDAEALVSALARAEAQRAATAEHFALPFAMGLARERLATLEPWEARAPILTAAVECYEAALALAEGGQVGGADLLPEVS